MSVVKRILEANKYGKHLPPEWEDKEYREKLRQQKLNLFGTYKTNRQPKKVDENQLSLF